MVRSPLAGTAARVDTHTRLQFIDAARGSAMFFVLLSHFAFTYFPAADTTGAVMTLVGMIASPTFMIINGTLLGMVYSTRPRDFERFRTVVTDRGLFLLTIGHLLILLSHATYAVRFVSITDVVGVCMLVSPWLVTTLPARTRLLLGLGTYAVTLTVILCWDPTTHYPLVLKETFFGRVGSGVFVYAFPILPWYSLELAATALGEHLGALSVEGDVDAMHRLLIRTAAVAAGAAAFLNLAYHALRQSGLTTAFATHAVGSPFAKTPPSLVYFLFYGSIGLVLLSACLRATSDVRMARVVRGLETIGRTSFAVFVIQFFIYFTVLRAVRPHLPWAWAWPVYFALSIVAIVVPAIAWHRAGYNRFLTVGYRRLSQELESDAMRRKTHHGELPASFSH
jgi:peptidoglycan/LPS O-acetylase OafA/YrhL